MTTSDFLVCPDCRHANIPGSELCEQCGQTLDPLHNPRQKNALERQIIADRISTLNPRTAVMVDASLPVREALNWLVSKGIGCLLIAEAGQVIGIFTERDALQKINTDIEKLAQKPVSDFMTPAPIALQSSDRIAFALHRMDLGGYRHVPIIDENQSAKVISVRDILRYMTQRLTNA
jgi:signal-transduction protein with cAMP-binding, CBS, and nucleotidyltransferase domain